MSDVGDHFPQNACGGLPPSSQAEEAFFDESANAWVLSRYADVTAAFRSGHLCPVSPQGTIQTLDDTVRLQRRAEATAVFTPAKFLEWEKATCDIGQSLASDLAIGISVDLVSQYAQPLCHQLAFKITHAPLEHAELVLQLSSEVSAASADPFDLTLAERAKTCSAELSQYFLTGPESFRQSGFVAIAQTLPRLIARCWIALLQHRAEWTRLGEYDECPRGVAEELLRYAGLTNLLFRMASADLDLNDVHIRQGERVILRVAAANSDPERFASATRLDIESKEVGQLTLGYGRHACVAAPLIKMVTAASTFVLAKQFSAPNLEGKIHWLGGSGFQFPESLTVVLQHRPDALLGR